METGRFRRLLDPGAQGNGYRLPLPRAAGLPSFQQVGCTEDMKARYGGKVFGFAPNSVRSNRQCKGNVRRIPRVDGSQKFSSRVQPARLLLRLVFGYVSLQRAKGLPQRALGESHALGQLLPMGLHFLHEVPWRMEFVGAKEDQSPRRRVAHEGRDQDVRVDHEPQGRSPGAGGRRLAVPLPNSFLDFPTKFLYIALGQAAAAEERVEAT